MTIGRRALLAAVPGAALAGTLPGSAVSAAARRPQRTVRLKLGCQSGPSTDEHFTYFARYGVRHICAKISLPDGRLAPSVEEVLRLREMAERHGLTLAMLELPFMAAHHVDKARNAAIMLADDPARGREIAAFQAALRACGEAGVPAIKYNLTLLGVLRVGDVPGRGDARNLVWNLAEAKPPVPLTRAGRVDADTTWERITYFLDQVVPVAETSGVRIACHPQDPGVPPSGYQGIDRVLGTVEGMKRFVGIRASAYHGLNFCCGTVAENLRDPDREIHEVVRWFASRNKIFNIHFRNIRGHRDAFEEVFPDEGDVNMPALLETLIDAGYDGMVMPDHVPEVPGNAEAKLASFAFAYGYIRGLIQSAAHARGQQVTGKQGA